MDRLFGSQRHKTGYRQEILAGMTTFLTMASIIIVNPAILEDAGTPPQYNSFLAWQKARRQALASLARTSKKSEPLFIV